MAAVDALTGALIQTQSKKCPGRCLACLAVTEARSWWGQSLTLPGLSLGRGRFGQVHKCEEKATGLKLAAKVIKTRDAKDKVRAPRPRSLPACVLTSLSACPSPQDSVRNEIAVMNQLDHVNLIQLYDAFESKNDIVLVME